MSGTAGEYFGFGCLYPLHMIETPEMYYCPSMPGDNKSFGWPWGWDQPQPDDPSIRGWRFSAYIYRIFGQSQGTTPPLNYKRIDELLNLEADANEALVSDLFMDIWADRGDPAHVQIGPYGTNVAYGDAHAKWVVLGEQELKRLNFYVLGISRERQDLFAYMYFRFLGSGRTDELDKYFPTPP